MKKFIQILAKTEGSEVVIYNEKIQILGTIQTNIKPNFEENLMTVGNKTYNILRKGWTFTIYEGDKEVYHLRTNAFLGNITILEMEKKLRGVFSLKWGTQLVDENNNTILKIKNESLILNKGNYIIELGEFPVSEFEIALALFGHLYGCRLKTRVAI